MGDRDKSFGSTTETNYLNAQVSVVCSGEMWFQGVSFPVLNDHNFMLDYIFKGRILLKLHMTLYSHHWVHNCCENYFETCDAFFVIVHE